MNSVMRPRFDQDGAARTKTASAVFFVLGENLDKPFKTLEELIDVLESRGLKTDINTRYILEREGYYAVVNGYKDDFLERSSPDERYKCGSSFSEIYSLFVMDRHLRTILFRYITLAEATLKSVCVYQFCARHVDDNEAYLCVSSYRRDGKFRAQIVGFVEDLKRVIGKGEKKSKCMKDYLAHYIENHDNVPLWVVMNNLSLGQAYKFFDFQDESIRFAVARRFQALYDATHSEGVRITHKKLNNAYNVIKDYRNLCAHDERLYCSRVGRSGASFADVLSLLNLVLSGEQHRRLVQEVEAEISSTTKRLVTISGDDIRKRMGFLS